ncbi:hypothetical protein CJF32_00002060 [Rutstroemia sp. NJR-2017a WRK4]|nr:hypothetical protein CJF32_00002060 [Rutstroemia sp. NJR-2017a WRK4]
MSSQDISPLSDASIHNAREQSGILTPSSQSVELNEESRGKKRKRGGNSLEDLLTDKFVIKPYPTKLLVRPRSLQPLLLLPRSHLPLSYLDIGSTTNPLPQSRLFEAHVKILELEERMGSQPTILIARLDDNRTLYAVEREDRGLYVVLQLGSWVNLQQLRSVAVVAQTEPANVPGNGQSLGGAIPEVPLITAEASKYNKKKKLAIEAIQSMVRRPSTPLLQESISQSIAPQQELPDPQDDTPNFADIPTTEVATQVTASEIFDNVRTQYFESLYLSKTSLAYFAKGPLSRARAAFHLDFDSTLDMKDHIAFLEGLVLSSTLLDKKYREGIPGCVSLIDPNDQSGDETKSKKKRKASKKTKPGKNGLYSNEETLIKKWWINHDEETETGAPGSSKEETMRTRIANLRIRETQLQMIVILEILALHPLVASADNPDDGLPILPTGIFVESKQRTPKTRKTDHLTMLIDVHIDRLCIWQSLTSEVTKAPDADSKVGPRLVNAAKHSENILRDFCIEVIAPFFSARLPDRCEVINRKLGGPVIKTAPKQKISTTPSRPGAVTKRPVPAKTNRSLQRALTDSRDRRSMSIGSNKAISLMRSATESSLPSLKRETSEAPSLSGIPAAESKPLYASRGGVLNTKRFSQREVDMSSLAPDLTSKAKKQAVIEAELKDAISALKKPNRELAGKALAETIEQRSISAAHPRKSKKPVRNPLFQGVQGVQIKATPKSSRQKDMFREPQLPTSTPRKTEEQDLGFVAPSSISNIPQSTIRSSRDYNPFNDLVQATPSRKSFSGPSRAKSNVPMYDDELGALPPSSPLQARRSSAQIFNSVPDSVIKRPSTASAPRGVLETPVKRPSTSGMHFGLEETPVKQSTELEFHHSHPPTVGEDKENSRNMAKAPEVVKPFPTSRGNPDSIYAALGWDDDDIDDLA